MITTNTAKPQQSWKSQYYKNLQYINISFPRIILFHSEENYWLQQLYYSFVMIAIKPKFLRYQLTLEQCHIPFISVLWFTLTEQNNFSRCDRTDKDYKVASV